VAKNPLIWGTESEGGPDGTMYFIKFTFSAKDVMERPLDLALATRDRVLQIAKIIRRQFIEYHGPETKD
jgi:hypothetical protein